MSVTQNLRNGMRAVRAGQKAEAEAAFRAVLDEDPANETALLWLGYLADDPQASLAHITQALESHLQSPRAYAALQWAWRRMAASSAGAVPGHETVPEKELVPEKREARPAKALRLRSGQALRLRSGQALRLRSGQALRLRSGQALRLRSGQAPSRHRQRAKLAVPRLPVLGALFLLAVAVGCMVGLPLLTKPPARAALASVLTVSPSPTVAEPPVLLTTPTLTPDPTGVPEAAGIPAPTLSPTPVSSPSPAPSPTPASVAFVVPAPFPIPGPRAYVPSTTLLIPTPVQPVPVAADAVNIVVLGSDQRPDWTEWHTDVVQVVSIQRERGAVSVISIPRDMYLYMPGLWMSRINTADFTGEAHGYEGGGPALVRDTLLYNLGIRVDHYVRTNFDGLIGIVDTVGGVDVPVHCRLSDYWPYPNENGEYPILTMGPGVRHMDGETALWYARSRKTTSVFSRERRQQQVLQALWHEGRDAGLLTQIPALWEQGRNMVETDLTFTDLVDLARIALTLEDVNVRFYNIGPNVVTPWTTPYGGAVFLVRWEDIQPIVAEAMAPIPEARQARTYMPVEVWNGTSNEGWGFLAADRLLRAGFPAVVGEADRQDYAETRLIIFSEGIKGSGAEYLQQMFRVPDDQVTHQPGGSSAFGFRLILGADYQTCPEP